MPIFSRFGADFFTVYADFSRLIRDINGEKKISLLMIVFSRLVFHGLPPLIVAPPFPVEDEEGVARYASRKFPRTFKL